MYHAVVVGNPAIGSTSFSIGLLGAKIADAPAVVVGDLVGDPVGTKSILTFIPSLHSHLLTKYISLDNEAINRVITGVSYRTLRKVLTVVEILLSHHFIDSFFLSIITPGDSVSTVLP